MKIKRGATIVFETGEYSSYSFTGPFVVIKAFDQAEVIQAFRSEWVKPADDDWSDGPGPGEFVPWLAKQGYVEDVPNVHSWHIGSYGRFEAEAQTERVNTP